MPAVFVHGNPETSAIWEQLFTHLTRKDVVALSPPAGAGPVVYGGRAKHRFSLDVIAASRGSECPRSKGEAESLADVIRSEIRTGKFRDPLRSNRAPQN